MELLINVSTGTLWEWILWQSILPLLWSRWMQHSGLHKLTSTRAVVLLSLTSKFRSPGTAVLPQRITTFKLPLTHKVGRNRGITYIDITKSYCGPVATLLQALSELEIPHWQVLRALPAALPTLLSFHIRDSNGGKSQGSRQQKANMALCRAFSDQNSAHQQLSY